MVIDFDGLRRKSSACIGEFLSFVDDDMSVRPRAVEAACSAGLARIGLGHPFGQHIGAHDAPPGIASIVWAT